MALADLQAAGFDTDTWQDRVRRGISHSSDWKIRWSGRDSDPPTILARTWLPDDNHSSYHYVTVDNNDGFEPVGRIDDSDQLTTFGCAEPILTIYPKEHDE